jgi:ABC-type cobalamin/Fe3+-siderophores transport system ATPase subunit
MTTTPTAPATALAASGLTKRYGPVTAVDHVSFQLPAGRIHLLVGPNGAGKSTLLRLLVGLSTPSAGSAWIGGRPFAALPAPARQVGAALEPLRFPPAAAATTCGWWPAQPSSRRVVPTRPWSWSALTRPPPGAAPAATRWACASAWR